MSTETLTPPQEFSSPPLRERVVTVFQEYLFPSYFLDGLTGLGNRTAFSIELRRKISKEPGNFSLIGIDLDGLKERNDQYGHAAGDDYIQQAGIIIRDSIRAEDSEHESEERRTKEQEGPETDRLYQVRHGWLGRLARAGGLNKAFRMGGDEFHAILNGVDDPTVVARVIARIEKNLSDSGISASIGGGVHVEGMTGSILCSQVDKAMYTVKEGRKKRQRQEEIAGLIMYKRALYKVGSYMVEKSGMRERRR